MSKKVDPYFRGVDRYCNGFKTSATKHTDAVFNDLGLWMNVYEWGKCGYWEFRFYYSGLN